MNILDPDTIMNEMQSNPNPPYEKIIWFIKKEAESFIALKTLLDNCENDKEFMLKPDDYYYNLRFIKQREDGRFVANYRVKHFSSSK